MAGLTLEQIKAMGGSSTGGLTLSQIKSAQTPVESKPSFITSLITDPLKTLVVKPGIRFGQLLGNIIAPALGATPEGVARANQESRTFAGMEVESQKAFGQGGARQIVGDAAKTASYLYTGGSVGAVANQTLRGQILAGGLTGFKTGAIGGGAYSFGEAIQNAENQPSAIAYQTLFGTALGGATGGILGATLPAISAGLTKARQYMNFDDLTEKLAIRNREILKPTSSQMAEWTQAKVDPIKAFSQEFGLENIPTSNNTLQLDEFISQTDLRYKAGAEGFNTILRNSPEVISISQREANALRSIENSTLTPSQKLTAKAKIQSEFVALKNEAQKAGQLLGDDNVPVAYADNLKDRFWGATKYFGPEEASVSNEVNRKIGNAFKEGIEEVITDTNVREYNKKLQELIYLKDFLESKNGKVPGTGGKMLRYTLRTVGAITGGGGFGSVAGAITADQIAQAIASPTARTWLIRRQLSKLPPEVRKSLEQEAKQILENMAAKRAETLRLPPPSNNSLLNQGRPIPVVPGGVEYTGGDVAAQSSNRAISQEATPNPNMIDNTNAINSRVNPQSGFVNEQVLRTGAGASLGATAGFERDEQGNVKYNVGKGLAGAVIGGVIGNKGKLGMSVEDVTKNIHPDDIKLSQEVIDALRSKEGFQALSDSQYNQFEKLAERWGISMDSTPGKISNSLEDIISGAKKAKPTNLTGRPFTTETKIPNSLAQEARKYKTAEEFVKSQGKEVYHSTDSEAFNIFDPTKAAKGETYFNPLGDGLFLSKDKDFTRRFGKNTFEYVLPKNAKTKVITDTKFQVSEYPAAVKGTLKKLGIKYDDLDLNDKVMINRLVENNPPIQALNEVEFLIKEDIAPKFGIKPKPNQVKDIMQGIMTERNSAYDAVIYRSTDDLYGTADEIIIPKEKVPNLKTKSQLTDIWNKANKKP